MVLAPNIPIAGPSPMLAVAMAATAGAIGLALFQLGFLRFSVFGHPLDLLVGLAFGTLAEANLVIRVAGPIGGLDSAALGIKEIHLYLLLFTRILATSLFLVGLAYPDRVIQPSARTRLGVYLCSAVALVIAIGSGGILFAGSRLPNALDPEARQLLESGGPIVDFLGGQEPWVLVANGTIALLLLVATIGYAALSRRHGDPHLGSLAVALTFLFFSQVHGILFPPVALNYVSTADALRLTAYLILLFSLVMRIGGEITERSSREERLRLSRELHDGLAQQLSLLNLRLNRASAPDRPAERRARDLEAAQRLVEAALLEARQAIMSLRTGTVSWEQFTNTVSNFADEFGQNHEVEVRLTVKGSVPVLEAALQVEVLRVLHETFSNAIRHGAATRIEVTLAALPDCLEIGVHDNGRGFDPDQVAGTTSVGLRSMSERLERRGGTLRLESRPGQGALLQARVPLAKLSTRQGARP